MPGWMSSTENTTYSWRHYAQTKLCSKYAIYCLHSRNILREVVLWLLVLDEVWSVVFNAVGILG